MGRVWGNHVHVLLVSSTPDVSRIHTAPVAQCSHLCADSLPKETSLSLKVQGFCWDSL